MDFFISRNGFFYIKKYRNTIYFIFSDIKYSIILISSNGFFDIKINFNSLYQIIILI